MKCKKCGHELHKAICGYVIQERTISNDLKICGCTNPQPKEVKEE